jgi:hypothetical protein
MAELKSWRNRRRIHGARCLCQFQFAPYAEAFYQAFLRNGSNLAGDHNHLAAGTFHGNQQRRIRLRRGRQRNHDNWAPPLVQDVGG